MLTSNRTRDLHDAVKRRCLYHWIDYPDTAAGRGHRPPPRSRLVADARRAGRGRRLAAARHDVQKPPGIAEAIDWLSALQLLGVEALDAGTAGRTLGSVLKYEEDQELVREAGLEDW